MNRSPHRRHSWILLLVLGLLACSADKPDTPRGVQPSGNRPAKPQPSVEAQPEPEPEEPTRRKLKSPFELGPGDLMAERPAAAPAAQQPAAAEPEQPPRDLGSELAEAVQASGCLDLRVAAQQPQGRTTVRATAYVTTTGRITRASVSAPGQPSAALRCAESRLVAQGLRGPVPGGAQSISGSTTLEVASYGPGQGAAAQPSGSAQARQPATSAQPVQQPADVASPTSESRLRGGEPDPIAGAP